MKRKGEEVLTAGTLVVALIFKLIQNHLDFS